MLSLMPTTAMHSPLQPTDPKSQDSGKKPVDRVVYENFSSVQFAKGST